MLRFNGVPISSSLYHPKCTPNVRSRGVYVINYFAQQALKKVDPIQFHSTVCETIPVGGISESFTLGKPCFVHRGNPRAKGRGNPQRRTLCVLQDFTANPEVLCYTYTGAQKEKLLATGDVNNVPAIKHVTDQMKSLQVDTCSETFNHYIYTRYDEPSDKIDYHRDGWKTDSSYHSMSDDCPIAILRTGPGSRIFSVRDFKTKQILFEDTVTPGTLIVLTPKANQHCDHCVKEDTSSSDVPKDVYWQHHRAGSLVLRGIQKKLPISKLNREIARSNRSRMKRYHNKLKKAIQEKINEADEQGFDECQKSILQTLLDLSNRPSLQHDFLLESSRGDHQEWQHLVMCAFGTRAEHKKICKRLLKTFSDHTEKMKLEAAFTTSDKPSAPLPLPQKHGSPRK